jgi:metal-sulfur cluster biosynthetic enzyme
MSALTPESVRDALRPIEDPEIGFSLVDLGLIRAIDVSPDGATVKITMTLTTPFCPEGPFLVEAVKQAAAALPGVTQADVELVWSPPWDPKTEATEDVRAALGFW